MSNGLSPGYIHGFDVTEQNRLFKQARFFEKSVYTNIDFSQQTSILEVGCGVGAQTQILAERYPHLKITSMDGSLKQLERAEQELKDLIALKQVQLVHAQAEKLPFADNSFDGVFICWFLEHVANPHVVLTEIRRVLKPGGVIYCNEVFNAAFYIHPYSHATLQYWFAFNDQQWNLKGDPFVGGKLPNFLMRAYYQEIETQVITMHFDNRTPKMRAQFIDDWAEHLLSGADDLLKANKVTPELIAEMKLELERVKNDPDAVTFYSWVQAKARAY